MRLLSTLAAFGLAATFATPSFAQNYVTATSVLPAGLPSLTSARSLWQGINGILGATSLATEGFESLTPGSTLTFAGGTIRVVDGGSFSLLPGNALITTEGSGVAAFSTFGTTFVEFLFTNPVNGFGIDVTSIDFSETSGMFADNLGNTISMNFFPALASATFFGASNTTAFNKVTLSFTGSETLAFDNLQWASSSVVPEPSTYVLMATGLAGLFAVRRRRSV